MTTDRLAELLAARRPSVPTSEPPCGLCNGKGKTPDGRLCLGCQELTVADIAHAPRRRRKTPEDDAGDEVVGQVAPEAPGAPRWKDPISPAERGRIRDLRRAGETYAAIATTLQRPIGSIKTVCHRLRQKGLLPRVHKRKKRP